VRQNRLDFFVRGKPQLNSLLYSKVLFDAGKLRVVGFDAGKLWRVALDAGKLGFDVGKLCFNAGK
jgi:hypothetical protein